MNEQLQTALAEIITKTTEGLTESVSFLSEQLPDVIHQLLLWYVLSNAIYTVFGIAILISTIYVLYKYSGRGEPVETSSKYQEYKWTLTHDNEGDISLHSSLTAMVTIAVIGFGGSFVNLTWLKILIAPKIWLIEYASSLVK